MAAVTEAGPPGPTGGRTGAGARAFSTLSTRFGGNALDPEMPPLSVAATGAATGIKALRGALWRALLKEAGVVLVGRSVAIRNPRHVRALGALVIEDFAEVQGLSRQGLTFGHRVTIGRFASIRPSGYYGRGLGEGLVVGDRSNIGPYCFVGCAGLIRIGDDVMMGQGVILVAEQHRTDDTAAPMQEQGVQRSGITIGNDCWLGSGSVILDGVTIGDGAIVGAGAVVTRSVAAGEVVVGSPARVLRSRTTSP